MNGNAVFFLELYSADLQESDCYTPSHSVTTVKINQHDSFILT